jgi:prepilin peptidase CpaA
MWQAFVLAFAVTVAIGDLWLRKIPRIFTVGGLLIGLLYHIFYGGFWASLSTAGLAFVLGLGLYELRAIGGGDVKLVTAMGAILGFQPWVLAIEVAIALAGLMALAGVIREGKFLQTFRNIGRLLRHFATNGLRPHPEIQVSNAVLVRVPFGLAAGLGTVCTLILK